MKNRRALIRKARLPTGLKGYYFSLHVWKSKEDMHKGLGVPDDCLDFFEPSGFYDEDIAITQLEPLLGTINITLTSCLSEIVHECAHAMIHWMRLFDNNPMTVSSRVEERLAESLEVWVTKSYEILKAAQKEHKCQRSGRSGGSTR